MVNETNKKATPANNMPKLSLDTIQEHNFMEIHEYFISIIFYAEYFHLAHAVLSASTIIFKIKPEIKRFLQFMTDKL